jgi:hypothetical protein
MGARPLWFFVVMLLPETRATPEMAETIMADVRATCEELGVALGGGHTEITQGLDRPILVGQMLGEVLPSRLVRKTRIDANHLRQQIQEKWSIAYSEDVCEGMGDCYQKGKYVKVNDIYDFDLGNDGYLTISLLQDGCAEVKGKLTRFKARVERNELILTSEFWVCNTFDTGGRRPKLSRREFSEAIASNDSCVLSPPLSRHLASVTFSADGPAMSISDQGCKNRSRSENDCGPMEFVRAY